MKTDDTLRYGTVSYTHLAATHRRAMSQMRGGFSKELASLRDQLLHFTSLIELELDFSDHEELELSLIHIEMCIRDRYR